MTLRLAGGIVAAGALGFALAASEGDHQSADASRARSAAKLAGVIDDFSRGASGWTTIRNPKLLTAREGDDYVLTMTGSASPAGVTIQRPLPAGWTVSFDLRFSRHVKGNIELGGAGTLSFKTEHGRVITGPKKIHVHRSQEPGGWYRLEATTTRVAAALDGQAVRPDAVFAAGPPHLSITIGRGSVSLRALIAGPASNPGLLLLQRLAWLHARTPAGKFPVGFGSDNRLHFSRAWTRGFWPGSLWQAFDLSGSTMFERWALATTLQNLGYEHADTHDLGFMYERSSVAAFQHLCTAGAHASVCSRLRHSALTAANSLLALAATNSATGTIPTRSKTICTGCTSLAEADTIVDSVMNLPLLFWASDVTGDPRYRDVAARHARVVAAKMVRSDGSTWASMHTRRSDGAFIKYHTHQGYSDTSTWARGQSWAVYGFGYAANALHDKDVLATAESTARYVMRRLPTPAVPLYDYDAPATAPHDVSAAVIGAAGMLRIATACDNLHVSCDPSAQKLRDYAHGWLAAGLAQLGKRPPLGLLTHQVYGLGGVTRWDDDAELIFGLDYALEAINGGAQ